MIGSVALLVVALTDCGGSGGSSDPDRGTLTIAITDASIDDYQEALFEVSALTLIGPGGQETEVLGAPQTIDLLALRNVSEILLRERLTARSISKLRLEAERITLNRYDADGVLVASDQPPIPTRKVDINLRGPIEIRPGQNLLLVLDVDLGNSIKIHETGNGAVRFRPVIFATAQASTLARLYGVYTEDDGGATLCSLERLSDADGVYEVLDVCVTLDETNATYFGADGLPLAGEGNPALKGDLAFGEYISAYGYYRDTANGPVLATEIIARGTGMRGEAFRTLNGVAATAFDPITRRFDLALTPTATVAVALSNGGKVFDDVGALIQPTAIGSGIRTEARGALGDVLQAFVAFATGADPSIVTQGTIGSFAGSTLTLAAPADPACVRATPDTLLFAITAGGDVTSTSAIDFADLAVGDVIEAAGEMRNSCLEAHTIIREMSGS
jgi:hypothetical protein